MKSILKILFLLLIPMLSCDRDNDIGNDKILVSAANDQLSVMTPDGAHVEKIGDFPDSYDFRWSPDSRQIVFESWKDASLNVPNIYIMISGWSRPAPIAWGKAPSWSPDGKKIIFYRPITGGDLWSGNEEIYSLDLETGTVINLSYNNDFNDSDPCYSPDGKKIVFLSGRDSASFYLNKELYIMNADGSNQTRLISELMSPISHPRFSPVDPSLIAYAAQDSTSKTVRSIVIYNLQTNSMSKSKSYFEVTPPVWSSDGKYLMFTAYLSVQGDHIRVIVNKDNQTLREDDNVQAWIWDWYGTYPGLENNP